jgi:hypothetical protein
MGTEAKGNFGKLTGTATVIRKNGTREEVQIEVPVSEEQLKSFEKSNANKNSDPIIKEK